MFFLVSPRVGVIFLIFFIDPWVSLAVCIPWLWPQAANVQLMRLGFWGFSRVHFSGIARQPLSSNLFPYFALFEVLRPLPCSHSCFNPRSPYRFLSSSSLFPHSSGHLSCSSNLLSFFCLFFCFFCLFPCSSFSFSDYSQAFTSLSCTLTSGSPAITSCSPIISSRPPTISSCLPAISCSPIILPCSPAISSLVPPVSF